MPIDDEIRRRCNMLELAKTWVVHEQTDEEGEFTQAEVKEPDGEIPSDTGMYWAAGEVFTRKSTSYPLVLQVSTDDSGDVFGAYWKINEQWCKQGDEDFKKFLGPDTKALFPVYYKLNVEFEGGINGGTPPGSKSSVSLVSMKKSKLSKLRESSILAEKDFPTHLKKYQKFLSRHGRKAFSYDWPGYYFAALLMYLDEKGRMHLFNSEYREFAWWLNKRTRVMHVILNYDLKREYLAELRARQFSEKELADYYDSIHQPADPDAGRAMLDGVRAIVTSLEAVREESVVILIIE